MKPMLKNSLKIPYGTRDFLPLEAACKRSIESSLMNLFTKWGYDEIVTPSIEYLDTLTIGNGQAIEPHMFKFFDRQNRTLALRHEMTTPIARVVASRMRDAVRPLKFSYVSNVFRYEQAQAGRQCEFYQAGVEFMGPSTAEADAEIIALAIQGLKQCGLENFTVCIGQIEFINGLMSEFNFSEETQINIREALEKRNLVKLHEIIEQTQLPERSKKILSSLPILHGDKEILKKAWDIACNEQSRRALDNLSAIYQLLESYGVAEFVKFDLGVIRDFDYYTGMVFEIYTPEMGFPLCGGGRYDRMLSDFGAACPSTGFALGIERIMLAVEREGASSETLKKDCFVAYTPGKIKTAIESAQRKRNVGLVIELAPYAMTKEEAEAYQKEKKYASLLYVE